MDARVLCCVFLLSILYQKASSQSCPDGGFGTARCHRCHCKQKVPCDKLTGACPEGCASGHHGKICQMENMARRLRTSQSSTLGPFASHYAVEGSYKQKDTEEEPHCIATDPESADMPWWSVELRDKQPVWAMRIFNNRNDMESLKGFEVYIDDQLCYTDNSDAGERLYDIRCDDDTVIEGQTIKVKLPGAGQLKFCEIEVFKCVRGFYDKDCASFCANRNCADDADTCNSEGVCASGCKDGYWGKDCLQQCPAGCRTCDHESGNCVECTRGLYNKAGNCDKSCKDRHCAAQRLACSDDGYCAACNDDWYGVDCSLRCDAGCTQCNKDNGGCDICKQGFYGATCELPCSSEERHCLDLEDCPRDGACAGECEKGWMGHNCSTPCPDHCAECGKEDGKCKECVTGYYYPNIKCERSCIERNCLKENDSCPYYGHCSACKPGFYGHDCTRPCSSECGSCDQRLGNCITCALGIYGNHCDMNCNDTERHCADGSDTCTMTGQCPGECSPGWFGSSCNMMCDLCLTCNQTDGACYQCGDISKYGDLCNLNCTERHCKHDDDECNVDGMCSECAHGWFGMDCTEQCDDGCLKCNKMTGLCEVCDGGMWGSNCDEACGDCESCDRIDGSCLSCDTEGYYGVSCGDMCTERHCADAEAECPIDGYCSSCEAGWHGASCNMMCGEGCAQCEKSSGMCEVCKDSQWGDDCSSKCEDCKTCNRRDGECVTCDDEDSYGITCEKKCEDRHCESSNMTLVCMGLGHCLGCVDGWQGSDCHDECQDNCMNCHQYEDTCEACEGGYYGQVCQSECSACQTCNKYNGICETCFNKTYGPACSYDCMDRHCIDTENCTINGFCGEDGCQDGWFGTHCDNPCSEFSDGCMQCSETECLKCNPGFYGQGCLGICPEGCTDCEQLQSGMLICKECQAGRYGENCQKHCGENCEDLFCEIGSGRCEIGCVAGTYGRFCDKECTDRCALDDKEQLSCDQDTGHCMSGCEAGIFGELCHKNCSENCGGDKACGAIDGECFGGCVDGLYQSLCNETCIATDCESNSCDRWTGLCVAEPEEAAGDPESAASVLSSMRLDYLLAIILVSWRLSYS